MRISSDHDLDHFYIDEVVVPSPQVVGRHGLAIDGVTPDSLSVGYSPLRAALGGLGPLS